MLCIEHFPFSTSFLILSVALFFKKTNKLKVKIIYDRAHRQSLCQNHFAPLHWILFIAQIWYLQAFISASIDDPYKGWVSVLCNGI